MPRTRTSRYPYISSIGKLKEFFNETIRNRPPPNCVNQSYLEQLDLQNPAEYRGMINLLSALRFINEDGEPTEHYRRYHGFTKEPPRKGLLQSRMNAVYADLFHLYPDAWRREKDLLREFFRRQHVVALDERTIMYMANTFRALCDLCDYQENDREVTALSRAISGVSSNIEPEHEDLLRQSLACFNIEAYRAVIVLAWTGVADYIRDYLNHDNLDQLHNLGQKQYRATTIDWSQVQDLEDLRENYSDYHVIEGIKDTYSAKLGTRIGTVYSDLDILRKDRNSCAHPTGSDPSRSDAISYIERTVRVLRTLSEKRIRQFS